VLVERRIPLAVPAQSTQPRQGARNQKYAQDPPPVLHELEKHLTVWGGTYYTVVPKINHFPKHLKSNVTLPTPKYAVVNMTPLDHRKTHIFNHTKNSRTFFDQFSTL